MTVAAPPADHVRALRSRLTGTALAPGDAGYDEARVAFNLMVQQTPAADRLPRRRGRRVPGGALRP